MFGLSINSIINFLQYFIGDQDTMKKPYDLISQGDQELLKNMRKDIANKYGVDKIYPANAQYFGSYTIIVAMLSCLQVFVVLYGGHFFDIWGISVSTGWFFLLPIVQYMFQIVTEVYGWEYARQLVLANFICNGLATLIYFAFHLITFSLKYGNHEPFIVAANLYNVGLSIKYMSALSLWIGMFISDYIICLLMSWSKFYMNGRYLLLRIAILHIISEILLQVGGIITDALRGMSMTDNIQLLIDSMVGRTVMMLLLLPVATWVIRFLQYKVEHIIVYDFKRNLSIFRLKIDPLNYFYVKAGTESNNDILDKRDSKELITLYRKEFDENYKDSIAQY